MLHDSGPACSLPPRLTDAADADADGRPPAPPVRGAGADPGHPHGAGAEPSDPRGVGAEPGDPRDVGQPEPAPARHLTVVRAGPPRTTDRVAA